MSLNSVNIMGNLTRDPEIRYTPSGAGVCSLSIANNRVYNKNGERVTEVSYFDIDVWGAQAENCSKYLSKGSGIVVEGRLRQDRWEKDGKTQSRVKITANAVHFLPKRQGGGGGDYNNNNSGGMAGASSGSSNSNVSSPDDIAWEE